MTKTRTKQYTKDDFERFIQTQNLTSNGTAKVTGKVRTITHTPYKIEKNVPMPTSRRLSRYPLRDLKVGDCFVVPISEVKMIRSAINRTHRVTKKVLHFITRTVNGRGRAGKQIRVWRV